MLIRLAIFVLILAASAFSQIPAVEPGVSHDLAKWRAVQYSNIRYKLNLTLEKMSPVLKGTIEIRLQQAAVACAQPDCPPMAIILDWRKIPGHEKDSTISNVSINGKAADLSPNVENHPVGETPTPLLRKEGSFRYAEASEHLIFRDGVVMGENVIKVDFTSPILTSGSAITRYVDKEDGAEYIYSLFVPSDASTAFPVFDQPDLKARFTLEMIAPESWEIVTNSGSAKIEEFNSDVIGGNDNVFLSPIELAALQKTGKPYRPPFLRSVSFPETKPISTYVFAFGAGPFHSFLQVSSYPGIVRSENCDPKLGDDSSRICSHVFVRKSQAAKFQPHAAEVARLRDEAVKYLETYFDYKFPFPKYDLVLIPEFPFGGMEHAGATFLRESSVIFPTEPTKNDYISRANLIFHETAHQWFGDTVTMKWFDDLWLKEGFANFMAYKALEKIMPEANAWKVFYERVKQSAYATDSTRGTTPIYQPITNLSAAKSAYGNIVYSKAPSFLRQAEFYLGEDKFQTAVRAFLKKHEFANAGWEALVKEFETVSGQGLQSWANVWIKQRGVPIIRLRRNEETSGINYGYSLIQSNELDRKASWPIFVNVLEVFDNGNKTFNRYLVSQYLPDNPKLDSSSAAIIRPGSSIITTQRSHENRRTNFLFPNYQDYGYGIFLLDDKSRDYVLKNIGREKDDFLRTMMWGSLWDSVREGELDPKDYVELVVKNLGRPAAPVNAKGRSTTPSAEAAATPPNQGGEQDEGTIQSLLGRVSTAMNYYLSDAQREVLAPKVEALLIDKIQTAPTLGARITYYRAFLNIASTERARDVLKQILRNGSQGGNPSSSEGVKPTVPSSKGKNTLPTGRVSAADVQFPLRTKDKFDIVTRLAILGDLDAPKLLADLEKTETSDDAKRYAYAARAGFATNVNKAIFWKDFMNNKQISESWIEAAMGPFNSVRHSDLTLPYLERALAELPNLKRSRKIFFVNGWLGSFIGGHRSEAALAIVNKFLADNPNLDKDLRLKILENVDLIERAVKIRAKFGRIL